MERLVKIILMPIRYLSYHMQMLKLYYWSEKKLYPLRAVYALPKWYYRLLYRLCICLIEFSRCRRFANRAIHTIPYSIRFDLA